MTGFFARLEARAAAAGTLLCVGLDPRVDAATEILPWAKRIIADTAPYAAAFKPNAAFYEAFGAAGWEALVEVVATVPEEIPVILDAKRGDIASSAEAYARGCFEQVGAGSVTLSPYLGRDAIDPFLAYGDRGVWVLARTSNPSATEIQDRGDTALHVASTAASWAGPDRLGLVVGATASGALAAIRQAVPEHWILAPGVGAQGADVGALQAGLRGDGSGLLVPVSRQIADATDPGAAARDIRGALRHLRPRQQRDDLASRLFDAGCVATGSFKLRSGVESPVYLDLRRVTADSDLLRNVASRYARVLRTLAYDHVAAVPYGAMAIATAVALETNASLIWPRREVKDHGTRSSVEGSWKPGDRVVLMDDVATSGASAVEAATLLRDAGLIVEDLIVLVERGPEARPALAAEHLTLHAATTLIRLADDLALAGRITSETRDRIVEFLSP
jgi:uridine monophosphate synthetase